MNLTHKYPDCIGRPERHNSNGILFWECPLCSAAGHDRPEDAERVSPKMEERLRMFTPAEAEAMHARLLAWALGIPEDAEIPKFGDLLQQVRGVHRIREETAPPPFRIVMDAIIALEKHWEHLTPAQQYNARDHLRVFAKNLPKIDPKTLPSSGEW